jgi:predicted nucleotidyltransferase/HEPN domain-containing protein
MKTSLDHLPENKQANVQTIGDIIHDEFEQVTGFANGKKKHSRIVLIILFGSYAKGTWVNDPENGYISDYDILVVLNRSELVEEYRIWHTAEERITRKLNAPVNILVHTLADVNERIAQGHYFFSDIREEGIQLYQYNGSQLVEPGELSAEEAKSIAKKHYEQWFENASDFLDGYQFYFEKGKLKLAAFSLHQVAEHFYACILLVYTNYRPKSHNLKLLSSLCIQQSKDLRDVFPQDKKFNRRCFELLKRAYIEARYSEHYEITEEELGWLEERVKRLKELTETLCRERIESMVPDG